MSSSPKGTCIFSEQGAGWELTFFTRCADRRYYEWLKKGTHRIPHFTRHKDRRLMLFAGLYDSVTLDGEYMLY